MTPPPPPWQSSLSIGRASVHRPFLRGGEKTGLVVALRILFVLSLFGCGGGGGHCNSYSSALTTTVLPPRPPPFRSFRSPSSSSSTTAAAVASSSSSSTSVLWATTTTTSSSSSSSSDITSSPHHTTDTVDESSITATALDPPLPSSTSPAADSEQVRIIPPDQPFRSTTTAGPNHFYEISIASMNLLAPYYHVLSQGLEDETDVEDEEKAERGALQRNAFLKEDRRHRVPHAIQMAKMTNADILCLQEVEGGSPQQLETLRRQLSLACRHETAPSNITTTVNTTIEGYDSLVWTPLNPGNKRGDIVGLCVAWRSQNHQLVQWEGYKRGMVCHFTTPSILATTTTTTTTSTTDEEADNHNDDEPAGSVATPTVTIITTTNTTTNTTNTTNGSVYVANLHLPARPSNILGRLMTMARTVRKLEGLQQRQHDATSTTTTTTTTTMNPLDGLLVVAGDWNSDQHSVAAQLLKRGTLYYGKLRDRNYKAKLTKAAALQLRHRFRFQDVYNKNGDGDTRDLRTQAAPITVSLHGRGPGCMDHIFFATPSGGNGVGERQPQMKPTRNDSGGVDKRSTKGGNDATLASKGKRRTRRRKAETRRTAAFRPHVVHGNHNNQRSGRFSSPVRVEAVLATVGGPNAKGRLQVIHDGLPNLERGFPSDHLPVGALFVASSVSHDHQSDYKNTSQGQRSTSFEALASTTPNSSSTRTSAGVTTNVQRRRNASRTSPSLRRRHNAVLGVMTDWLVELGAHSLVRDRPLCKNELVKEFQGIQRKSRAPDLMFKLSSLLGVMEIAVAANPETVYAQKMKKYEDLVTLLQEAAAEKGDRSEVNKCRLFVIVIDETGPVPGNTRKDMESLLGIARPYLSYEDSQHEIERVCSSFM